MKKQQNQHEVFMCTHMPGTTHLKFSFPVRPLILLVTLMLVIGAPTLVAQIFEAPLRIELVGPPQDEFPVGQVLEVPILFYGESVHSIAGFDFLINFRPEMATFDSASAGPLLDYCGWEFFEARSDTPGFVRVVGVADLASVAGSNTCYFYQSDGDTIAYLYFSATTDPDYECLNSLLGFHWLDCADNALASVTGDSLFVEKSVWNPIEQWFYSDPDTLNSPLGLPDSCVNLEPLTILRTVDFVSSSIEFACNDTIDPRGDINLNGIANEVADWVLFQNYFLFGFDAWNPDPQFRQAQIAASDINADGIPLSIRDLAYIYRIVIGDALPFPKPLAGEDVGLVYVDYDTLQQQISFSYPEKLCFIYLIFDGSVSVSSSDPDVALSSNERDGRTHVIAYPGDLNGEIAGNIAPETVFSYTGDGQLDSLVVTDWNDRPIYNFFGSPGDCGDVDGDGLLTIGDVVAVVNYIFANGSLNNPAAADFNCSGTVNITDAVAMIYFMFSGGPPCEQCR